MEYWAYSLVKTSLCSVLSPTYPVYLEESIILEFYLFIQVLNSVANDCWGMRGYDEWMSPPRLSPFSYKVGIKHETDAIQLHSFPESNATYIYVKQWAETLARSSDCHQNTAIEIHDTFGFKRKQRPMNLLTYYKGFNL